MAAPAELLKKVKQFQDNRETYMSDKFGETELRLQFIDPMFESLGWDVHNRQGNAEAYKDVVHEDSLKIGGSTKSPDYSFRIGGMRIFFVEAKKASVNIKHDLAPALQVRRYAWSAKLPLSILTDFEEFAVYDCRVRPDKSDSPSTARTMFFTFEEYEDRWDEIAGIFSREAVLKGSFDRYAESAKKKRGTAEVDAAFLDDIEQWRLVLARNLALRNPGLSQRDLNFAVQKIIDRIIFLRICEDRGMETYGRLQVLPNGPNIYPRLCELFQEADHRYNSGLFHFAKEKERHESPDEWTLSLTVDDAVLKDIIRKLYYPESPYEFSVIGADILGQVYEQFLGKVIRLTTGHQAKVEEKPEVRKAGGVYYTPTYIVEYIVKNTVGKLLEGKTPYEVAARTPTWKPSKGSLPLSVLDPACGSGSFLIGAYQYLLDWYRDWFVADDPARHNDRVYQSKKGQWRLSTAERKRILLDHIYGVDIDAQAVEVTKLSLLLKVLEGETKETLQRQLFAKERALPDLADNIKCGNSLIGPDFYHGTQLDLFDDDDRLRINVFDWQTEFRGIMQSGGFDAVIGNPPYVFTRNQGIDECDKRYYYDTYKHQSVQLNTFSLFVERCRQLLIEGGSLGFITPNNWLTIDTFSPLRRFVIGECADVCVMNIKDRVFTAANVDTAITLFRKGPPTALRVSEMLTREVVFCQHVGLDEIKPPSFIIQIGLFKDKNSKVVIEHIERKSVPLASYCRVSTGLKAYQVGKGKPAQTNREKAERIFHSHDNGGCEWGPYLDGVDVRRYSIVWSGDYLKYGDWLAEPRKSVPFNGPRILVRQIPAKPPYLVHAVYTDEPYYHDINSMVVFEPHNEISLCFLLALINSRLMSFWFLKTYDKLQRKIFPQFKVKELAKFPVFSIDLGAEPGIRYHREIGSHASQMIVLHNKHRAAITPHEQTSLERQIASTNQELDGLVYSLYGLTADEIRIVEEATAAAVAE